MTTAAAYSPQDHSCSTPSSSYEDNRPLEPTAPSQTSRLPDVLRSLGVITLLASVSIYLLQSWETGSDLTRFFLLWGHTLALTGVGLFCSRFLKEQKSARILLIMSLVFAAGNFAILGGFVFSMTVGSATHLHTAIQ